MKKTNMRFLTAALVIMLLVSAVSCTTPGPGPEAPSSAATDTGAAETLPADTQPADTQSEETRGTAAEYVTQPAEPDTLPADETGTEAVTAQDTTAPEDTTAAADTDAETDAATDAATDAGADTAPDGEEETTSGTIVLPKDWF